MGIIHVLSEAVANKIAAGEIIERPASIVKELIENSLDAGAASVEVEIKHGGKSLIRVADNGCGMSPEDAELAFQRHATSKISGAEDLLRIASFGFRGEALPSIAAVSRLTLTTRVEADDAGTEVCVEGGVKRSVKPKPGRVGTVVEVRDLFFNTPARRKFLRTDPTELGHVLDVVTHLALANPAVHFTLSSANKSFLSLTPAQTFRERAFQIWGEDQSRYLLEIQGEGGGIQVSGIIGKPTMVRANRSDQVFFINRRWIRHVGFSYALQEGYHGLMMHGQYPVGVLFVDVDPERVDVNVHPTKQEVRISKESEIKSLICRTVAERLQKEGDLAPDALQPKIFSRPLVPNMPEQRPAYLKFQEESAAAVSESVLQVSEPETVAAATISGEAFIAPIVVRDQLHITKVLGQIHHTFIVAETEAGMILIDQHAAHERVMFEATLKEFQSGHPKRQRLLMDEIFELHPKRHEILKWSMPLLEKIGFEIEPFGENAFVVRAYPAALADENPVACLERFLEEMEDGKTKGSLENAQENLAALFACKRRSVKAHDPMTGPAMQTLLERLARCDNPFHCPHGRPTFFKYSFLDLEKQFKRK